MGKHIRWGVVLVLLVALAGLALVAFYIGKDRIDQSAPESVGVNMPQGGEVAQPQTAEVRVGYKRIKVSDSIGGFQIDVPESWFVETRHSGERRLSGSEMREYLAGTVSGEKAVEIGKMDDKKTEEMFNLSNGSWQPYPTTSVSPKGGVQYGEDRMDQIDFYIIRGFDKAATYYNHIWNERGQGSKFYWSTKDEDWKQVKTACGKMADFVTLGKETGKFPGAQMYFIKLGSAGDMLVIERRVKGNEGFEQEFAKIFASCKVGD